MNSFTSGDQISCIIGTDEVLGTYITERDSFAVIKLKSGYNIGLSHDQCRFISHSESEERETGDFIQNPDLPLVSIISTGGTIASRIDYRTGAVTSQCEAKDILQAIPGLAEIGRFRTLPLRNILSENMTPAIWQELAHAVYDEIQKGAEGIIVTHGTDTMAYSAAAVSFMVQSPVPVVFVGSQRSADRPSSDNVMNGICAATAALSDLGEVVVVMHETTNDDRCTIIRGTRVRKMHTSARNAFVSLGTDPLGYIDYPSQNMIIHSHAVRRNERPAELHDRLESKCGLLSYHPGLPPEILKGFVGYKGLVIAGTGLGHVSTDWIPAIRSLIQDGMLIVMTSQCLHGRVCDRVYDTGRDLMGAGVIEGEDMLPEVALVKLMWVLGNSDSISEATQKMRTNLVGEMNRRSVYGS